jgi:hypothetical protein
MTASASDITRLRRMVAEPSATPYSDTILGEAIQRYPIADSDGHMPDSDLWSATYDLNAAAAEIWQEKAAALVGKTDFAADGANYSDSQAVEQAERQVRYYLSRRCVSTIKLKKWPVEKNETDESEDNEV